MSGEKESDSSFFGREEIIKWIGGNLDACSGKGILLGLHGMGGIGKTAILRESLRLNKLAVYIDCEKENSFDKRLRALCRGAEAIGIDTPRYDILSDIKLWFYEGLEPAEGRSEGWVRDLVEAVPYIGTITKIGLALAEAGGRLKQIITKHHGTVKDWLHENLGKDYGESLLRMLNLEYEQAMILLLEAIVEDFRRASHAEDAPILLLIDSFDIVNNDEHVFKLEASGIKVSESELWQQRLSDLEIGVALFAGRNLSELPPALELTRSDKEVTMLDDANCHRILKSRGVDDDDIRERIVELSHGNPLIINVICDTWQRGEISLSDIGDLRSDELLEVRERAWSLFLKRAPDVSGLVQRAAFLPFFDYGLLNIICADLDPTRWKKLARLSFIQYEDPYWLLHDLVRDLALGEYGTILCPTAEEISRLLATESSESETPTVMGLALSVKALCWEDDASSELRDHILGLQEEWLLDEAAAVLETVQFPTDVGRSDILELRAETFRMMGRVGEMRYVLNELVSTRQQIQATALRAKPPERIFESGADKVRLWLLAEDRLRRYFGARNVPADTFLDRIWDLCQTNDLSINDLDDLFNNEEYNERYYSILAASPGIAYLPPYQAIIAFLMMGQGSPDIEVVARVNEELQLLGKRVELPPSLEETVGTIIRFEDKRKFGIVESSQGKYLFFPNSFEEPEFELDSSNLVGKNVAFSIELVSGRLVAGRMRKVTEEEISKIESKDAEVVAESSDDYLLMRPEVNAVREWLEEDNRLQRLFGATNMPAPMYLQRIERLSRKHGFSLYDIEEFMVKDEYRVRYEAVLAASPGVTYLPPYQAIMAFILMGEGKSDEQIISRVNEELTSTRYELRLPPSLGIREGTVSRYENSKRFGVIQSKDGSFLFFLNSFQVYVTSERQAQLVGARVCFSLKLSRGRFVAERMWFPKDGEACV